MPCCQDLLLQRLKHCGVMDKESYLRCQPILNAPDLRYGNVVPRAGGVDRPASPTDRNDVLGGMNESFDLQGGVDVSGQLAEKLPETVIAVVLTAPRAVLHQRIAARAQEMVTRGIIEETAAVLAEGLSPNAPGLDAIGPREAIEYLHGQRARDTVAEAMTIATRQYAKRQETWFRHQLSGDILTLDATRSPEIVAEEIVKAWGVPGT